MAERMSVAKDPVETRKDIDLNKFKKKRLNQPEEIEIDYRPRTAAGVAVDEYGQIQKTSEKVYWSQINKADLRKMNTIYLIILLMIGSFVFFIVFIRVGISIPIFVFSSLIIGIFISLILYFRHWNNLRKSPTKIVDTGDTLVLRKLDGTAEEIRKHAVLYIRKQPFMFYDRVQVLSLRFKGGKYNWSTIYLDKWTSDWLLKDLAFYDTDLKAYVLKKGPEGI